MFFSYKLSLSFLLSPLTIILLADKDLHPLSDGYLLLHPAEHKLWSNTKALLETVGHECIGKKIINIFELKVIQIS